MVRWKIIRLETDTTTDRIHAVLQLWYDQPTSEPPELTTSVFVDKVSEVPTYETNAIGLVKTVNGNWDYPMREVDGEWVPIDKSDDPNDPWVIKEAPPAVHETILEKLEEFVAQQDEVQLRGEYIMPVTTAPKPDPKDQARQKAVQALIGEMREYA